MLLRALIGGTLQGSSSPAEALASLPIESTGLALSCDVRLASVMSRVVLWLTVLPLWLEIITLSLDELENHHVHTQNEVYSQ